MKRGYEWRNRGIAAVLAVAMLLSCVYFVGIPQVWALKDTYTVTGGELVAQNYSKLTAAEKELLTMLGAGGSFTYDVPDQSDNLVRIDTEAKTIAADSYTSLGFTWKPVSAQLHDLNGNKVEDVALSNGKGSYSYGEASFTVHVTYTLSTGVDSAVQVQLLGSLQELAAGKRAADSVSGSMDDLDMIVTAMDALVQLRNGLSSSLGGALITVQFGEEAQAAVDALYAQYRANGGKLALQQGIEAYTASPMVYLSVSAKQYHQAAREAYDAIHTIAQDPLITYTTMDAVISSAMPSMSSAWKTLKSAIKNADAALAPAAESWPFADNARIPAGLSVSIYDRMGELVDALNKQTSVTAATDLELKKTLWVADKVITCNSRMVDVQLKVELLAYDDTNELKSVSVEHTEAMEEGTALPAVAAAAEMLEASAVETFASQGIDLSGYVRSVQTDITGALTGTEEASYTVVYTPREYIVSFAYDGSSLTLGYGYRLTLEAYPGTDKVYDYDIAGTYYPQNSVYVVSGDVTVNRTAMKPVTQTDMLSILAQCYGTDKEAAVLTSGALLGNETISLRWPDNDDGKLIVSEAGKLTVGTYNSGYRNMHWLPYSYTVGDRTEYFKGASSVLVSAAGVDSIPVVYRLELTNISADKVQTWLDDVKIMSAEADAQMTALEKLNAQYANMGQINKAVLNFLKNSIYDTELHEDWQTNEELQDYMVEVVGNLISDCVDTNGKLRIYNILTKYREANSGGLVYYYRSSEEFIREVDLLGGYLGDMLADDLKTQAMKTLMSELGYPQYADRFTELKGIMNEVSAGLMPPHERIDVNSQNLDVLVQALTMSGTVGTTGAQSPYLEQTFQVAAPSKAVVQITVSAGNRVLDTVSVTYELEDAYVLTQADVDGFKAQIRAIVDGNLQSKYYTQSIDVDLDSLVGKVMDSSVLIKIVCTPITYTVHIEGMGSQTITVENPVITLPEPNIGFRNDYSVDGVICGSGTYRFTTDQLDRLFTDGSYTISVTKVNVAAERLEAFLADLNEAGKGTMGFVLNDDKDTVTVNVAAGDQAALNACIQDVALTMMGGYGYIGLDGRGFLYTNDKNNTEISLQTVYDAVLHDDGFSHQTLIGLQDGEGVLTVSTIQLGDSADALEQDLIFEIYLTSVSDQLKSVARAVEQMQGDLTFRANNGVLDVHVNPREQMYQALLSGMLLTGRLDKTELNAPSGGEAVNFLLLCMNQMVSDENVTMATYENTLAFLGWDMELAGDQLYYEYIANILRNAVVTEQEDGCRMLQTIDIRTALDEAAGGAAMAPVLSTIKEYNTDGIQVDLYLSLELRDNYQAMILDPQKDNGMYYTEDLAGDLKTVTATPTVVLLTNLTGNLPLPQGTVLDLNGFDVTGNITASGKVVIVDSSRDTFHCGSVSGSLTGDITVYGGKFAADVTAMLESGYIQEGGVVRDGRFIVRSNADGSATYEICQDAPIRSNELALDIAADMLLGGMSTAKLNVDGTLIYDLVRAPLMTKDQRAAVGADLTQSILDSLQTAGLGDLVADVLEDLTNYKAAASGKPLGTYQVTENLWEVEISHITEGDYLDFSLVTSDRTEATTVHTAIGGKDAAAQAGYLQELITGTDVQLKYAPIETNANGISSLRGTGSVTWNIDLTARKEYATILGVILGYAHKDIRAQIAGAINTNDTQDLKNVFNALTARQLLQALQAMDEAVSFAQMAKTVGVTADVSVAGKIEAVIHSQLCAIGADLDSWTITGGQEKLGSFESKSGDGSYVITGLKFSSKAVHTVGITQVEAAMELTNVTIRLAGIHKVEAYDVLDTKGSVTLSGNDVEAALKALKNDFTLRINHPSVLNFWTVKTSFHVENAHNITVGGFRLIEGAKITADGPVQVYTSVSGYVVKTVKSGNTYTYTLEAIQAPTRGADLAKVWTAKQASALYLCVDADPSKGVTLDQLKANLIFSQFAGLEGTVKYTIAGNNGTARVKTGDKLTITVVSGSFELARIEYTVIITGDVNKDGRVTAGDAVAMMKIYKGETGAYNAAQLLAADTNRNGTDEKPRIDAGDAVRIMKKYMDWKSYMANESGK